MASMTMTAAASRRRAVAPGNSHAIAAHLSAVADGLSDAAHSLHFGSSLAECDALMARLTGALRAVERLRRAIAEGGL